EVHGLARAQEASRDRGGIAAAAHHLEEVRRRGSAPAHPQRTASPAIPVEVPVRHVIEADDAFQRRLKDRKIFLSTKGGARSLPRFVFRDDVEIEPFTGFYGGSEIGPLGAFACSGAGGQPRV